MIHTLCLKSNFHEFALFHESSRMLTTEKFGMSNIVPQRSYYAALSDAEFEDKSCHRLSCGEWGAFVQQ